MKFEEREISEDSRLSFASAFGIDPSAQRAVEDWYDSAPGPQGNIPIHTWQIQLKEAYDLGAEWFDRYGHDVGEVGNLLPGVVPD
jgi:hypothetical protein